MTECNTWTKNDNPARMFYVKWEEYPELEGAIEVPDHLKKRELIPSPTLNISVETFYANESLIGYTYNVTLNGYVASRQTREQHETLWGFGGVVGSISRLQQCIDEVGNGGILVVMRNTAEGDPLNPAMKFKGSRIKNWDISPGDNQMVFWSDYTLEMEFNDVDLYGCNYESEYGCSNVMFADENHDKLVDFGQNPPQGYRIKEFTDGFTFEFQDEIHNFGRINEALEVRNKNYTVTYNVSAKGQHFYDEVGDLFPAWKQAKAFCQDRLVKQINAYYNNVALHYNENENLFCGNLEDNKQIHNRISPSIHTMVGPYNIYNEKITITPSESDGTCSMNYSAILKEVETGGSGLSDPYTIHTVSYTPRNAEEHNKDIGSGLTIQGNIQGLTGEIGSIIYPNSDGFRIPDSPNAMSICSAQQNNVSQYERARNHFKRLYNEHNGLVVDGDWCMYLSQYIEESCTHTLPGCPPPELPCTYPQVCKAIPNTYSSTHNVNAGNIDYTMEWTPEPFDTGRCNITISTEEPVPIVAEFTIPGYGVYYQPLGGETPLRWTINAEGNMTLPNQCPDDSMENVAVCVSPEVYCENWTPPDGGDYLLAAKSKTYNPVDGSFSYSATYICAPCPPNTPIG